MDEDPNKFRVKCANCGATFQAFVYGAAAAYMKGNIQNCNFCDQFNEIPEGLVSDLKKNEPPRSNPRELHFSFSGSYVQPWPDDVLSKLRTWGLRIPARSFMTNVARLQAMTDLPENLSVMAPLFQEFLSLVMAGLPGTFKRQPTDEEWPSVLQNISKRWVEWLESNNPKARKAEFARSSRESLRLIEKSNGDFWMGLEALLISQVTGTWTAFEVLAGDLWEAALNVHPDSLSSLKQRKPKAEKSKDTPKPPTDEDKSIKLNQLQRYNFDVSRQMGTLLKDKFKFTILASIREAYWQAFGEESICRWTDSINLKPLAAIRNVFVHKAGIMDEREDDLAAVREVLPNIQIGERIPLDGPLVQQIISPVIADGVGLIQAVDDWIVANPSKVVVPEH